MWAFGYPGVSYKHTPGEAVVDITAEPTLIEGEIIGIHPEGRGSWTFPQFEVTCPFEPGISGGPIIHNAAANPGTSRASHFECTDMRSRSSRASTALTVFPSTAANRCRATISN